MNPAELFRQDSNTVQLKPGETLFRAGDAATDMYVLLEGIADIAVGETVVETATSGALLGEMALIESAPRTATVRAKTVCRLARVDSKRFNFLVQQTPFFALHVMKVLADRVRRMNERMVK